MRDRTGFTTIGMAIAVTMAGLVVTIAIPRLSTIHEQAGLNHAKRHLLTQLSGARSSAIQGGATVSFVASRSAIYLTTSTGDVRISQRSRLLRSFGVEMKATDSTITFDARGFATTLPAAGAKFVLTRGTASDSVCVTRLGLVLPHCGL